MSRLSARGNKKQLSRNQALARESGFSISSAPAPLPTYDALRDANLRQHFESRGVQRFLQQKGWVDKAGKIIDLDKYRSKLNIIEQEFRYAEKTEFWRLKEEDEMRRTIQIKRERALQDAKRQDRARTIKEENRIRKGLISVARNSVKPEEKLADQHLDVTTGTELQQEAQAGSEADQDEEQDEWPVNEPQGGFFVTQQDTHKGD
mmetsp:Transcript_28655/g.55929  ORF Transcript_28655/g.55929 Transcript_28655/m.55929 type:complete len:205 (+) Transcript_28655:79-693(+)